MILRSVLSKLHEEYCPICYMNKVIMSQEEVDSKLKLPTLLQGEVKEENVMSQKEWWIRAYQKLIENLLSVKVWILGGGIIISSIVVFHIASLPEVEPETLVSLFSDWCAYNGGVVTAVLGLREAFKVAKLNGNGEKKKDNVMV